MKLNTKKITGTTSSANLTGSVKERVCVRSKREADLQSKQKPVMNHCFLSLSLSALILFLSCNL